MNNTNKLLIFAGIFLVLTLNFASALSVDADYVTLYAGEQASVTIDVENTENFDIEDVSVRLDLSEVPFTSVGSSEKDLDDLDEGDDDKATFKIRAATDIIPGDYDIPYEIRYTEVGETDSEKQEGTIGVRVSAKTDIDFSVETRDAIVGKTGKLSLEIINKGLGDLKSVSVEIFPQGYELLSKEKIFVGTVSAEDSDIVAFDVVFENASPTLSAKITFKDFDNNEQTKTVNLPVSVYTRAEALELGLIQESKTGIYIGVVVGLIVIWFVWRKIAKARRKKNGRR